MATSITDQGLVYPDSTLQTTAANVASGIIIMWGGSIDNIPDGWYLCDGNNGTPNLTNRFIVGAGSTYNVDDVGGSANAIISAHTHTATLTSNGDHNHEVTPSTHTHDSVIFVANGIHNHTITANVISPSGAHDHGTSPTITFPPDPAHSHPYTLSAMSGPGALAHEHPVVVNGIPNDHNHAIGIRPSTYPVTARTANYLGTYEVLRADPNNHINSPTFVRGLVNRTLPPSPGPSGGGHVHDLTLPAPTTVGASHSHDFPATGSFSDHLHSVSMVTQAFLNNPSVPHSHTGNISSFSTAGNHIHDSVVINSSNVTSSSNNTHTHELTVNSFGDGADGSDQNLPPYYSLAFLMKA